MDNDLAHELRERAHQTDTPFKTVVNKAIRAGLAQLDKPGRKKPYCCRSFSLGYPPLADIDHALKILDQMEAEEINRKLSLRK